jgi:glutamate dehydrogenase (NAD(P)+)
MWMTWKCAVTGLPYGGTKGGVTCQPSTDGDIPAPDVNTDARIMAWIMDTLSMHKGFTVTGTVTSKPLSVGGTLGRVDATGRGVMIAAREAAPHLGWALENARLVVQGFGNAGYNAARLLVEQGCKLVAANDSTSSVYSEAGLDPEALKSHKNANGSFQGFPDVDRPSPRELLELPCDILVPAALEGQITGDNADAIQARLIVEAANGPTTPEADAVLADKGALVVPDILANAGGVVVSYFEWVQDLQQYFWDVDEVNRKMESIMMRSFAEVLGTALKEKVAMRDAAMMLAVQRVVEAITDRGVYP